MSIYASLCCSLTTACLFPPGTRRPWSLSPDEDLGGRAGFTSAFIPRLSFRLIVPSPASLVPCTSCAGVASVDTPFHSVSTAHSYTYFTLTKHTIHGYIEFGYVHVDVERSLEPCFIPANGACAKDPCLFAAICQMHDAYEVSSEPKVVIVGF